MIKKHIWHIPSMDTKILEEIGLTKGEIKVYVALFELGASTSGPIARQAGVSPSKVYPILNKLSAKSLVGSVIRGKTRYFEAAGSEKLLGFLEQKKDEITSQQHELERFLPSLPMPKGAVTKAFLYEGLKSVKNMYNEILLKLGKGDTYLAYGISGSSSLRRSNAFFQDWQMRRGKKGIKGRIIYDYSAADIAKTRAKAPLTEVRVLPKDFKTPAGINVFGDTTAIILWIENPVLFMIENKEVADSFRQYFALMWKIAKEA